MAIVSILERGDGLPDLFEVAEDAPMNDLFLQRAVEAFGDTVGFVFGHNGEARSDAQNLIWLRKLSAVHFVP